MTTNHDTNLPTATYVVDGKNYVVAQHAFIETASGDTLLFDGRGYDKFGRPFILKKDGDEHTRDYKVTMSGSQANKSTVPAQKRSKTYFPHGPRLYFFPSMGR